MMHFFRINHTRKRDVRAAASALPPRSFILFFYHKRGGRPTRRKPKKRRESANFTHARMFVRRASSKAFLSRASTAREL